MKRQFSSLKSLKFLVFLCSLLILGKSLNAHFPVEEESLYLSRSAYAASQTAVSLLAHSGNIGKALQELGTREFRKSVGASLITAALIGSPGRAQGFEQHLTQSAVRAGVKAGVQIALYHQDPQEALISALKSTAANTVGGLGAQKIGEMYQDGQINSFLQMGFHMGNGAVSGMILGGVKGAAPGAIGADVSEFVATGLYDLMETPGIGNIELCAGIGKISAVTVAALTDQDMDIALTTASNAIENNFLNYATGKLLKEKMEQEAEALYKALETIGDKLSPGMTIEKVWEDLERLKDHTVGGILGYSDLWQENGQAIARFIGGNERLEYAMGDIGGKAGLLFGVGMTAPNLLGRKGNPGGGRPMPSAKPIAKGARGIPAKNLNSVPKKPLLLEGGKGANPAISPYVQENLHTGFYNPHGIRQYFENKFPGRVSSSTVPAPTMKNVKLAGQIHSKTGIVFDQRGLPVFDKHVVYETKLPRDVSSIKKSRLHMTESTKDLKAQILAGKIDQTKFTEKQLEHIFSEKPKIDGLTWHHHQDIGRMQLIDEVLHTKMGHIGGMKLWFDN